MPPWLRALVTAAAFAVFFGSSAVAGAVLAVASLFTPRSEDRRARFTRRLNIGLGRFAARLRRVGLIDYEPPESPPVRDGRSFLVVANHPTLLDVLLILGAMPDLICVVKASWYRHPGLRSLIRRTKHIPGPGHEPDALGDDATPVVRRMEEALRRGHPVLVFPEGTRSDERSLRRFRRGGIEAAIRAGAPIAPLFVGVDRPFLQKGRPIWHVPSRCPRYELEWLDPVETSGRAIDGRRLTRELAERYDVRFERMLRDRERGVSRARAERGAT